jgi:undecaprenyl-diphosphatase
VWATLIVILSLSKKQPHRRAAFYLVVSIVSLIALGDAAKFFLFRSRPSIVLPNANYLLPPELDSSFPSGHSLVVSGCATVVWFTLNRKIASALTLEAMLVSFSRLYVGAHFPMDVIGGVFFGVAIGAGVMAFQHYLDRAFRKVDFFWQNKLFRRVPEQEKKNKELEESLPSQKQQILNPQPAS